MKKDTTTLVLRRSTKKRLDAFLEKKGDTYDDILNRLVDKVEELKKCRK